MKKLLAISAITLLTLAACNDNSTAPTAPTASASGSAATNSPTAGAQSNRTVYRVRSEQLYEPFITRSESNQIEGFDHDLLKAIGEKQGFDVQFEARPFSELLGTLEKDDADIVSSGLAVTDERKQVADFSVPYFDDQVAFLVGKDVNDIASLADVKGKNISVQTGSPSEKMVIENGGTPVGASSTWLAVKPTISGQTPVTFGDMAALNYYIARYPNQGMRLVPLANAETKHYAFAVKKGNNDLLRKLNDGLAQIKSDGTYEKIRQKWFEQSAAK